MAELNGDPHRLTVANLPQGFNIKIHGFTDPRYDLPAGAVLLFDRLEGDGAFCKVEGTDNEISIDFNTPLIEMGGDEYKVDYPADENQGSLEV